MLDIKVINDFRDFINSNSDYIYHKTHNKGGKNKFNIICSAMDWITVAVNNINEFSSDFERAQIDRYCMHVFSYISTIDIILESVIQLSRVITEKNESPFKGECIFFSENTLSDDDEYFKHIRAVFGAHPVNLKNSENSNERWFASWPTVPHFAKYDMQVFLYSNNPEKSDKVFGIYIKELNKYVKRKYLYIRFLKKFIEREYRDYVKLCQDSIIQYSGDVISDLMILQEELMKRLPNDYVEELIEESILFLQAESTHSKNDNVVLEFMAEVKAAVPDLKYAVQNLDYEEKESYKIFEYNTYEEHHYEFQKYMEILSGKEDCLEECFFEVIANDLRPYVYLNSSMSYQEIKLLIYAGLYSYKKRL